MATQGQQGQMIERIIEVTLPGGKNTDCIVTKFQGEESLGSYDATDRSNNVVSAAKHVPAKSNIRLSKNFFALAGRRAVTRLPYVSGSLPVSKNFTANFILSY